MDRHHDPRARCVFAPRHERTVPRGGSETSRNRLRHAHDLRCNARRAAARALRALYLLSVSAHVLAAIVWVGSNVVLAFAVVPFLRDPRLRPAVLELLRSTGPRLSGLGWGALAVLVTTGAFNLHARGFLTCAALTATPVTPLAAAAWAKLLGFAGIIALHAAHDLAWGPAAAGALERDPRGLDRETVRLRCRARAAARGGMVLSVALVFAGVVIVRGWF